MTLEQKKEQVETSAPQRRCICCRGNGKKTGLLRFAVIQGCLCFDLRQKLPGRGYYVCAQMHCLEQAFESGFKRIAKHDSKELAPDAKTFVREILLPGLKKRYTEYLLAGYQSHRLLLGADSVEHAAQADQLAAYIIASDASEATAQKYRMNAERKQLPVLGLYDRSFYGCLFGKSDKVVLGWMPGTLFDEFSVLESMIQRLSAE